MACNKTNFPKDPPYLVPEEDVVVAEFKLLDLLVQYTGLSQQLIWLRTVLFRLL